MRCRQLAGDDETLVATCATESAVLRLDPRTGQVTGGARLPQSRLAAVLDGEVWVDTADRLARLRPDLGVAPIYPSLGAGLGGDLQAAAGVIWLRAGNGAITRVEAPSGRVLERIALSRTSRPAACS